MTTDESTGSTLSYEQARGELVEVVQRLEAGGSTLEESLALWERGEELARVCRDWLEGARARLDAVLEADAGADEAEDDEDDALDGGDGAEADDDEDGDGDDEGAARTAAGVS
ncbi:exodeoxyribonuclease VII small subunit [Streptomyces sp. Z26]|uniref:exodeoxyribonuclease VII small subunit n=1 Tax=Streptomyces TaxID=1883 RepID=UPI00140526EC|nr:exodeoxyribonuclease VII small subunit [Streptomyces sp. Z26]